MNRLVVLLLIFSLAACGKPPVTIAVPPPPETSRLSGQKEAIARITPDAAKISHIEVRVAEGAEIRETVTLYGMIKSNAERQQSVRARFPGVVKAVAKRVGERVARGETLLTIESNDSLEPYTIVAPMAGTVIERNINPGENVDGSATLIRLADLSTVWAEFAVFSRDLARTRPGMPIVLTGGIGNGQERAKIAYVAPIGSGDTQSVSARVVVDNEGGRWIAGQFVTGDLEVSSARAPVTVAPDALQRLGGDVVVFVANEEGFVARRIDAGRRDAQAVEVLRGLSAGERYAAKNSYLVKAELQKGEGGMSDD